MQRFWKTKLFRIDDTDGNEAAEQKEKLNSIKEEQANERECKYNCVLTISSVGP